MTGRHQRSASMINREDRLRRLLGVRNMWRAAFAGDVDHQDIMARINAESGWVAALFIHDLDVGRHLRAGSFGVVAGGLDRGYADLAAHESDPWTWVFAGRF